MKRPGRFFSYFICATLIATMFSFAPGVFAAEKDPAAESSLSAAETVRQQESQALDLQRSAVSGSSENETTESTEPTDPTKPTDPTEPTKPEPPKKYCRVTVQQTSGGTVAVDKTSVEQGVETTIHITVTPNKGYGVASLNVNGEKLGATYTYDYTFTPSKDEIKISASFRKSSSYVFIMLDAGHYGKVNRSPVLKSYYESLMTWPLHLYLKQELEQYQNVVVDTTRGSQSKDLGVYARGTASAGYDLFLSLHSNATGSKSADYPLVITQKGNTKDPLAVSLAQTIQSIMGTKDNYQIWQKLNKDKKTEYYGVLRGSKAVGTKGMIVEHSFHTNLVAAKWLSSDANLHRMAEAEAADIAAYYGLTKSGADTITPSKPSVSISNSSYNALTLKWKKSIGATGYVLYRATSKKGSYKKIKTISKGTTLSYKNSKLKTGKTYYYKVRPFRKSASGTRYGSYSSIKSAKVKPGTPSVSSKAGKRKITVKWKKVTGASRYVVYRATKKSGKYKKIATLKSNRRSYTNKKLKKNKRYYYKVRAYRTVKGKKYYSNYSSYTTKKVK
ncbi:N-acetylmuramoyl-L-alanine amidase [Anaerovorax odorimutans]|uniref:N-acetylmuramoyl-L-alanine amidase n=1 Tax=Anaerovorax odorimutans TaxID=109327 RepID=A0ABT1RKW0_9FIRM|nr:N-acetylmuramoyl-L-alanine amidase [Anaerovorax odorimutans]MCQ4635805.1 N-acetylmuramoyl-L-alanine amidase [Anaerovorax odorimutans]